MNEQRTIGEIANLVRSKNAGPFWQTIDIFLADDERFRSVATSRALTPETIARLYRVDATNVQIFRLPDIRVVKISFPRPTVQGGAHDRDMHAGQQHIPIANLIVS